MTLQMRVLAIGYGWSMVIRSTIFIFQEFPITFVQFRLGETLTSNYPQPS